MAPCDKSQAIAAIRAVSYIVVILIPACLPALGCNRKEPEPPPEVKNEAVYPEKTPIEDLIFIPDNFEDLQKVDPPKPNDSPQKTPAPSGERKEKVK